MARRAHVAVIGGGPAGSAAAALLARSGIDLEVTLLEKDAFPRDKLCGEFLSPESLSELDRLGALSEVLSFDPARIARTRFTTAGGRVLEARLPGEGLGLSRRALDRILFDHAARSGAGARSETEVVSISTHKDGVAIGLRHGESIDADLAICAYGRRAKLDRALDRPFMEARSPYVALKRHHRPISGPTGARLSDALARTVEIHAFLGGYCGLCFIEDGEVNVCMLLEQRALGAIDPGDWRSVTAELEKRSAILAQRLEALEPSEPDVHAVAEIPFASKERARGRVLFIGDAAGMIAPFAGDGQAMALTSARILAELVAASAKAGDPSAVDRLGEAWDRAWRRHFETRMQLGRMLQRLLLNDRAAGAAVAVVGSIPGLAPLLVRLTRG